ncbi:3D domain-containing protein [Patescibacteria group bacterium]|nr:3D domain-containing protein [Patescibacteria group bacterium]
MAKNRKKNKYIKHWPDITSILLVCVGLIVFAAPNFVKALEKADRIQAIDLEVQIAANDAIPYGSLPKSGDREVVDLYTVAVSAYNSVSWQTDSTPCIGAAGSNICLALEEGSNTCAANFVPLGTLLYVDGMGTCVVRDRMNARYDYRVDWYMGYDIAAAKLFGVQYKKVSVIAYQ